jgi:sorbitol-specific phosphotransferase system component IIC
MDVCVIIGVKIVHNVLYFSSMSRNIRYKIVPGNCMSVYNISNPMKYHTP